MMFDDEDTTKATSQELWLKASSLIQVLQDTNHSGASQWWLAPLATNQRGGQLENATCYAHERFQAMESDKQAKVHALFDDVISFTTNEFKPQLTNWVNDVYPSLESDGKSAKEIEIESEDIQYAITSILGFSVNILPSLKIMWEKCQGRFRSSAVDYVPAFITKLTTLSNLAIECCDIFNTTGFIGLQWFRWALYRMYYPLSRDTVMYTVNREDRPTRSHPQTTLQTPYYSYVLDTISTNPAALALMIHDNGFGLVITVLQNDILNLIDYPEKLAEFRPFQLANVQKAMSILDHFISLITSTDYNILRDVYKLIDMITWLTTFLSCHAIKAKEMSHPYDLFASRLAEYALWRAKYIVQSGSDYWSQNDGFASQLGRIEFTSRQICLSKNSLEYMTPVYNFIMKYNFTDNIFTTNSNFCTPLASLRPKLADLTLMPTLSWFNDTMAWSTNGINASAGLLDRCESHWKWWKAFFDKANDVVVSHSNPSTLIQPWDRLETNMKSLDKSNSGDNDAGEVLKKSPLELFYNKNCAQSYENDEKQESTPENCEKSKKDFSHVFGTVQYITGTGADYRVKVVKNGASDIKIKAVSGPATPQTGQWKVVKNLAQWKIKLVDSGSYDFSIKFD